MLDWRALTRQAWRLGLGMGMAAQSIIVAAQWSDKLNKKLAINWCKLISFYIDIFIEFCALYALSATACAMETQLLHGKLHTATRHITYTPRCTHLVGQVNLPLSWAELIGAITIISLSLFSVASLFPQSLLSHHFLQLDVIYAFFGVAFTQFCSPDRRQQCLFMGSLGNTPSPHRHTLYRVW